MTNESGRQLQELLQVGGRAVFPNSGQSIAFPPNVPCGQLASMSPLFDHTTKTLIQCRNGNSSATLGSLSGLKEMKSKGKPFQPVIRRPLPRDKRRYACPKCAYATDRRDLFTRHENIHRDEKPFHCYVCSKMFNRADHVKKHFLRIHKGLEYDVKLTKRIPGVDTVDRMDSVFKDCGNKVRRKSVTNSPSLAAMETNNTMPQPIPTTASDSPFGPNMFLSLANQTPNLFVTSFMNRVLSGNPFLASKLLELQPQPSDTNMMGGSSLKSLCEAMKETSKNYSLCPPPPFDHGSLSASLRSPLAAASPPPPPFSLAHLPQPQTSPAPDQSHASQVNDREIQLNREWIKHPPKNWSNNGEASDLTRVDEPQNVTPTGTLDVSQSIDLKAESCSTGEKESEETHKSLKREDEIVQGTVKSVKKYKKVDKKLLKIPPHGKGNCKGTYGANQFNGKKLEPRVEIKSKTCSTRPIDDEDHVCRECGCSFLNFQSLHTHRYLLHRYVASLFTKCQHCGSKLSSSSSSSSSPIANRSCLPNSNPGGQACCSNSIGGKKVKKNSPKTTLKSSFNFMKLSKIAHDDEEDNDEDSNYNSQVGNRRKQLVPRKIVVEEGEAGKRGNIMNRVNWNEIESKASVMVNPHVSLIERPKSV